MNLVLLNSGLLQADGSRDLSRAIGVFAIGLDFCFVQGEIYPAFDQLILWIELFNISRDAVIWQVSSLSLLSVFKLCGIGVWKNSNRVAKRQPLCGYHLPRGY